MNFGLIISSIALGISLTVSAIKLVDWLIHADPRAIIRLSRWLLLFLAIAAIPSLLLLLVYQYWTFAMMLGAGMLIVPVIFNWRAILPRPKFRPLWTNGDPLDERRGDFGQPPSPEVARRAAIILEDYLLHVGYPETAAWIDSHPREIKEETPPLLRRNGAMSAEEALEILGLPPGATGGAICIAHRHLLQLVHPDHGGTNYLAAQINRAKETLLAKAVQRSCRASPHNGAVTEHQPAAAKDEG